VGQLTATGGSYTVDQHAGPRPRSHRPEPPHPSRPRHASSGWGEARLVQVLEYVPDVLAALAELHRTVRPGGRVLVWDIDWRTVSWHSGDPGRMARVLQAWDEHLLHSSLPRTLAAQLRLVGFDDVQMAGHTFATTRLDPDSFAATVCQFVTHFVAGRCGLTEPDVAAWMAEQLISERRNTPCATAPGS
ncbi:MAG TPA: hypothetical protein VN327_05230, partial [Pseudonocardiaceae bacterium]|nr:hypothetical protein [Pseudonocardiaceae bacterium]